MKKLLLTITCVLSVISGYCQYGTTVREDRVWEYICSVSDGGDVDSWTERYHFSGAEDADGTTYAVLRNEEGEKVALMRQVNKTVYIWLDESQRADLYPSDYNEGVLPTEIIVYDFSKGSGQSYEGIGCDDRDMASPILSDYHISEAYDIEVGSSKLMCQLLDIRYNGRRNIAIVESIGVEYGLLYKPVSGFTTGSHSEIACLENVYDLDGNVIFTREDFNSVVGVVNVTDSSARQIEYAADKISAAGSEIAVADLSGKRVAEGKESVSTAGLQPGVYVATAKNGKATHTMKILVK